MLNVNDYVVYKKDICIISEIKEIRGNDYYILIPLEDRSLTISLPVSAGCFRTLISYDEAMEFINRIPSIKLIEANNDKLLEMAYKKMILSLDNDDLISIIKTTYLRNKHRADNKKKLGSIDSYYLEEAEKRLVLELSIVLHLDEEKIRELLSNAFNK